LHRGDINDERACNIESGFISDAVFFLFFKASEAKRKARSTSSINEIPRAVNWREKKGRTRTSKAAVLSLSFLRELKHPWLSKPPPPLPHLCSLPVPVPFLSYIVALIIASKSPALLLYLSIDDVPLSRNVKEILRDVN